MKVQIALRVWVLLFSIIVMMLTTTIATAAMHQNDEAEEELVDKNSHCNNWALQGECIKNLGYMAENCAKSCSKVEGEDFYEDEEDEEDEYPTECWWNYQKEENDNEDEDNNNEHNMIRPGVRYSSSLEAGDYVPIVDVLYSYEEPEFFHLLGKQRFNLVFPSFSVDSYPWDNELERQLRDQYDEEEFIVVEREEDVAFRRLFTTDGLDCNEHGVLDTSNATSPHLFVKVGLNMKILQTKWFAHILDLQDCSSSVAADENANKCLEEPTLRSTPNEPYSPPPPILVVPNAIDSTLAQDIIDHMDAERSKTNNADVVVDDRESKRRNTIFLEPRDIFTERIDEKLSKSVYPEIEKVFFYRVNSREDWRVGRYTGENKGVFQAHRDTKGATAYRKFAISVLLTDDYEGGGLSFPEYSDKIVDVPRYSAVVFPGSLIHEVKPIQNGLRYVIIGFLFNSKEEEDHAPSRRESYRVEVGRDTRGLELFDLGMEHKPWTYEEPTQQV